MSRTAAMLAELGYWGLAQVDFVETPSGFTLLDVNPRFYRCLPLAVACGTNLPALWHAVAVGRPVGAPRRLPDRHDLPLARGRLRRPRRAARRRGLLERAPHPSTGAAWAAGDPLPGVLLGCPRSASRICLRRRACGAGTPLRSATEVHRGPLEPLLPEWEQLFAADDEATPFSSAEWARAWWPHWAGAGTPFDRHGPRRRPARRAGAAGAGAARPVPRADRAGSPARQLLGRAVPSLPRARRSGRSRSARCAARSDEWHALLLGGCAHGLRHRARRARDAGCACAGGGPRPIPGSSCPAPSRSTSAGCRASAGRTCAGTCAASRTGGSSCATSREPAELRPAIDRWQDIRVRWWQHRGKRMDPEHASTRFRDFMQDLVVADGAPRAGAGMGAAPRRRGGGRRGEPHRHGAPTTPGWARTTRPSSHLGLGKLAIGESIRESIAAGREYYDLMVGDEDYKYWYGATDRALPLDDGGLGPPAVAARAGRAARRARDRVRRASGCTDAPLSAAATPQAQYGPVNGMRRRPPG